MIHSVPCGLMIVILVLTPLTHAHNTVQSLRCEGRCTPGVGAAAGATPPVPSSLAPPAYDPLPLGSIAPQGWLLGQLLRQANSLSGYMAKSTFPGADHVNTSSWIGGNGSKAGGTDQWLPYWTNGNVPLVELIRAAGPEAVAQLDEELDLPGVVDGWMAYVMSHTNTTNGWIGPYQNEPGDSNGHGLWDPLNMLRSLLNYAQAHPDKEREIAKLVTAHLTQESTLIASDPIYKWAQTRWPTFVEICQYHIDKLVPKYGADPAVMPLGAAATTKMLLEASTLFQSRGMDWPGYYHQTGAITFPEGSVPGWNTNDHGVNNAEGAMRWPSVVYRMSHNESDRAEQQLMLGMLDKYQGQVAALFCADEVFCGRQPNRGTETCAVVEAITSLEMAFATLGDPLLIDRAERLAFNALPAALTADMWTHVYVQQANSVFAGVTKPHPKDHSRRSHHLHHAHQQPTDSAHSMDPNDPLAGCPSCQWKRDSALEDRQEPPLNRTYGPNRPSGEDQGSNFYGVSHFPCCITNFPQGWPKFAMNAYLAGVKTDSITVASLVPAKATLPSSPALPSGGSIRTDSQYPFSDDATITVDLPSVASPFSLAIRIPGWAHAATVNGTAHPNGTLYTTSLRAGRTTLHVKLNPEVVVEVGWGSHGNGTKEGPALNGAAISRGPLVFVLHPREQKVVTKNYTNMLPARPLAVDYQISTEDPWNYALLLSSKGDGMAGAIFDATPSAGWSLDFPFDDSGEYPFSIKVQAQRLPEWGYWDGSNCTDIPPSSPVDCTEAGRCSVETTALQLVPYGSTNIRIAVFPWIEA